LERLAAREGFDVTQKIFRTDASHATNLDRLGEAPAGNFAVEGAFIDGEPLGGLLDGEELWKLRGLV
jgi:hypothetical protein